MLTLNLFPSYLLLSTLLLASGILPASAEEGWAVLFNGKDLSGWTMGPDKSWVVEDGVITLKRNFDGKEHNSDYLWADGIYGDFVLELEFKTTENANSGIFLRTANINDPVYTGLEVQVNNSWGKTNLSRTGTAGAIYDCIAPSKNAAKKAGEWNHYQITCKQNRVLVVLNGDTVVDMDLDQWTVPNQNPDGSKNKFSKAMKDFAREGRLGLQDHGRPVWYRNIKIKKIGVS